MTRKTMTTKEKFVGEKHDVAFALARVAHYLIQPTGTGGYTKQQAAGELARIASALSPELAAQTLGDAKPGLPPGESDERNAICDALTEALIYIGDGCDQAGERSIVDLCDAAQVRELARMMTIRDRRGLNGSLDDNTQKLWERIGCALHGLEVPTP